MHTTVQGRACGTMVGGLGGCVAAILLKLARVMHGSCGGVSSSHGDADGGDNERVPRRPRALPNREASMTNHHGRNGASRRDFLKLAGAGAAGAMVGMPAAQAAPKTLTFLHDSSFIRDFDAYFQHVLAPAYEKETGIKIDYPLTSVGTLQTRVSAIIETGSGADVMLQQFNWAFLYDEKLVDLSDLAEEIGKTQGGWYDVGKEAVFVNGKWKAIPFGNIGQLMNYRVDWFHEAGYDKFPDTWDELLEAGIKLNKKGYP